METYLPGTNGWALAKMTELRRDICELYIPGTSNEKINKLIDEMTKVLDETINVIITGKVPQ